MQPAVSGPRTHQEQAAERPSVCSHHPGGHTLSYDIIIIIIITIIIIFVPTTCSLFPASCCSLCSPFVRPVRSVKRVPSVDGSNSKTCWCRRCRDSLSIHYCWTASSNTLRVRRHRVRKLDMLETFMWRRTIDSFCFFFSLQPSSLSSSPRPPTRPLRPPLFSSSHPPIPPTPLEPPLSLFSSRSSPHSPYDLLPSSIVLL